ncbi:MAG: hypothetical protein JST44_13235 [Cyanobacteria bacterium SZAS LIN-5]|nr:hypothetical protein [Cyanobacteria bacterium SZAS LIN-5]
MSDNERDTRGPQRRSDADLYNWSGDCNGNGTNGPRPGGQDLYKFDGSGRQNGNDNTAGGDDNVPANWHPDYSLSSKSAQEWFQQSQALRKQKLDLDENGDHVVQHGDSLWTIAQRELHDHGKQGTDQEIKAEIQRIAKLNESMYPSLMTKPDFIRDGWKLHIEPGGRQQQNPGDRDDRCLPQNSEGNEVTPPGYRSKPRVIVNNVYTDNAYFNQGPGCQQERPDRCLPNRGDDVYRYSGDQRGPVGGNDLYAYSGDRQQQNPGRNGDLYAYGGDGGQRPRYNDTPYNGTGNDGTSFYPGAGSAQDQLWQRPDRGGAAIINNVYAENAYFDQRSGCYDPTPGCRIMQRTPYQSGEDNYYNCNRGRGRGRVVQVNDNGDGNYDQYPTDQPQYPTGDGSTNYYTYRGGSNPTGDYYSDARSQQGVSIDTRYSTYRNPAGADDGTDDQYAY